MSTAVPPDLAQLRAQWQALATMPLDGLPRRAIEASVRDLARELLSRTRDGVDDAD